MIEYINRRLNTWADWCINGRKIIGLGYPSQCAFSRMTPPSPDRTLLTPVACEEAWEIEQAISRLEPRQRDLVRQFYLHTGTAETHAKALRMHRDTLYARLHRSHISIMEWLQVGDDEKIADRGLTRSDTFGKKQLS